VEAGVPQPLALSVAALPAAYAALSIVETAQSHQQEGRDGHDVLAVGAVHLALGQRLGLDRLLGRIVELPRTDRWQTMARAALRDDLHAVHAGLTAQALRQGPGGPAPAGADPDALGEWAERSVVEWERTVPGATEAVRTLRSICSGPGDLARMSVGLRVARGLLPLSA